MAEKSLRFRINRPSDDAQDTEFRAYHRCREARNGNDVLTFYLFFAGSNLSTNAWWPVSSEEPCPACGREVTAWFQWKSSIIIAR